MIKLRGNAWEILVAVILGFFIARLDQTVRGAQLPGQRYRSSGSC
jgi:hypothetical protein